MNIATGLSTLDPAYARDLPSIWMTSQLYCGLVAFDEELHIRPLVAERFEVQDSGRTYVFHLRDDVWFHKHALLGPDSSRKVVAADFKYSFERICNPDVAANGFWIFNGKVQGLEAYREGSAKEVSGFEAPDDHTFIIRLNQPMPPFLGMLAMPYGFVVPREVAEAYGKDFRSHPVGCGPFRFKSWNEGRSLILHRNPDYFEQENGSRLPHLDAVHVRFIRSRLSEFVEFSQGNLDFVNGIDKSFKDEIFMPDGSFNPAYKDKFTLSQTPQLNTEFLGILVDSTNEIMKDHPLRDKRVRQALNYAIDRKRLVEYLLNGNGYPANSGIMPMGIPGFDADSVQGYSYRPDLAAKLLRDAGYPGGKGIPVISLKSTPTYQNVMDFVQKSFERIGVRCEIDNMESATLREQAGKGMIRLWRASWIADYPDGENYLSLFYSGNIPPNGANRMRYQNAEFDSLYEKAQSIPEDSLRQGLYRKMEKLMLEESPVILLYYDRILRLIANDVEGLETNAMNMLYLKRVRKPAD